MYEVVPISFNGHPQWGFARGFRLKNTKTGILSMSWYTNEETAQFYCNKLNSKETKNV